MYEDITPLHQRVREFVEKEEPDYKVISIDGYSTAKYNQPPHVRGTEPDYFLSATSMHFRVRAVSHREPHVYELKLEVELLSNGEFLFTDTPQATRNSLAWGKRR